MSKRTAHRRVKPAQRGRILSGPRHDIDPNVRLSRLRGAVVDGAWAYAWDLLGGLDLDQDEGQIALDYARAFMGDRWATARVVLGKPDWSLWDNQGRARWAWREADLRGAQLKRTHLRGLDLARADLRGARLMGCLLDKVNLAEADLRKANLSGAQLLGCYTSQARLRGAKKLTLDAIVHSATKLGVKAQTLIHRAIYHNHPVELPLGLALDRLRDLEHTDEWLEWRAMLQP